MLKMSFFLSHPVQLKSSYFVKITLRTRYYSHVHNYIQYIPHVAMPLRYVIDMHCYQSMSLVQDMVIVDVMKPQNNYIVHLTDIIITTSIIIVNLYISNTTYIAVNYITFWIIFINK